MNFVRAQIKVNLDVVFCLPESLLEDVAGKAYSLKMRGLRFPINESVENNAVRSFRPMLYQVARV